MKRLLLKITICLLAVNSLFSSLSAQDTAKVTSTFIGSQGYLLESESKKVALDAIIYWGDYNYGYIKPPIEIKPKIEEASSPFNKLDLILISHAHKDHCNSTMIEKSMTNNPEALLITNSEVYNKIANEVQDISTFEDRIWIPDLEFYHSIDTVIKEIPLTITNIEHGTDKLYVYSFVLDGIRFVQLNSWNTITGEMYDTLGFNKTRADIAYLGYDYLLNNSKFELFKNHINPVFSTISHIDGASQARFNIIQNKINEVTADYPMNLIYTPLEQLRFNKVNNEIIVDTIITAPVVVKEIEDITLKTHNEYSLNLSTGYFAEPLFDIITYDVKMSNGDNLPDWLSFSASTNILSGTPTESGSYTIKVIASSISKAVTSIIFTINVEESSSIDQGYEQNIQVYPNPTHDNINISFGKLSLQKISVDVFRVNGTLIASNTCINSRSTVIDLTSNPKGVYLVKIKTDAAVISKRILLE